MAPMTRAMREQAFIHITQTTMDQPAGSPLAMALDNSQVNDILFLITLTKEQIAALKYDDNGTLTPLGPGPRNEITTFIAYLCHCIRIGMPVGNDYLSVTQEELDNYSVIEYMVHPITTNDDANQRVANFLTDIQNATQKITQETLAANNLDRYYTL